MSLLNRGENRVPRDVLWIAALLVIVSLASLIIAEQVVTGWLALGERANISRRDLNFIEIGVIVGTAVWGLLTLWTAFSFLRRATEPSIEDYFENPDSARPAGILLTIVLLGIVGIICLIIAEQVITGWLALGERANISRRDLNTGEWLVIIGGTIWGAVTLRTAWGLLRRDRPAWSWAQWIVLFNAIVGLVILISGLFDLPEAIPQGETIFINLPTVQQFTAPGLLLFFSSLVVYRVLAADVRRSADAVIRNTLARTPGAGAIVGFVAIFIFFSVATDLFLNNRSLAGALTTNITRGVIAIGITYLMISGEFDLSIGSLFGASGLMFLLLMTEGLFGALPPIPPVAAAIGGLIFACLLGLINGLILVWTRIPSLIVTLGTLLAYRAIPLVIVPEGRILRYADYFSEPPIIHIHRLIIIVIALAVAVGIGFIGRSLLANYWSGFRKRLSNRASESSDFRSLLILLSLLRLIVTLVMVIGIIVLLASAIVDHLGQLDTLAEIDFFALLNGQFNFVARDVNLRTGVLWWFLLVLLFQFILTETSYGNATFAVGGNPGAALAQGVSPTRVKLTNFVLAGLLAGVASLMDVARVQSVDALRGEGLELQVIAASVIGGTLLSGGYGSIFGALLGVFIFGMLSTGLVLLGMNPRVFNGVIGIIIIVAVVINTAARQQRE